MIEAAGDAGDKSGGNEDGRENHSDADDRAGHFFHGFVGGFFWREPMLDVMFDGFDDNDGIVDDQADGENQSEERKSVDGEAEQTEKT